MLRRVGLGHELPDPAVWITNLLSPKGGGGDQWAVKKPSPSVSVCTEPEYCTSHTETSLSPSDTLTVALGSGQQRQTTTFGPGLQWLVCVFLLENLKLHMRMTLLITRPMTLIGPQGFGDMMRLSWWVYSSLALHNGSACQNTYNVFSGIWIMKHHWLYIWLGL